MFQLAFEHLLLLAHGGFLVLGACRQFRRDVLDLLLHDLLLLADTLQFGRSVFVGLLLSLEVLLQDSHVLLLGDALIGAELLLVGFILGHEFLEFVLLDDNLGAAGVVELEHADALAVFRDELVVAQDAEAQEEHAVFEVRVLERQEADAQVQLGDLAAEALDDSREQFAFLRLELLGLGALHELHGERFGPAQCSAAAPQPELEAAADFLQLADSLADQEAALHAERAFECAALDDLKFLEFLVQFLDQFVVEFDLVFV